MSSLFVGLADAAPQAAVARGLVAALWGTRDEEPQLREPDEPAGGA